MKKITLLFTAIVFFFNGFSQITFQKRFVGPIHDFGTSVRQTTDGGYIISASTDNTPAGNGDILLIKTNEFGDTLWTKIYDQLNHDELYMEIEQTTDGGYIVISNISSAILIIKTDSNGDSLWTRKFDGNVSSKGGIQQTNDGGYIIGGNSNNAFSDIFLIKTDSIGTLLWGKTYGGSSFEYFGSVRQTNDGGYIIAGRTNSFGAGNYDGYLVKTNGNGDTLWTRTFGAGTTEDFRSVSQTSDGGYIAAGEIFYPTNNYLLYFVKTDSIGGLQWSKAYSNPPGGNSAGSVQQTSDGGYIAAGYTQGNKCGLFKTDGSGNLLWAKSYGDSPTTYERANSVVQTADGGYIMTGVTNGFGGGMGDDIYLVKTDSLGNSGCNGAAVNCLPTNFITISSATTTMVSLTGATDTATIYVRSGCSVYTLCTTGGTEETSGMKNILSLSPNPATSELVISGSEFGDKSRIEIYNVLGEKRLTLNPAPNGEGLRIDVSSLASGIYFVKVKTDKGISTAKFVKE